MKSVIVAGLLILAVVCAMTPDADKIGVRVAIGNKGIQRIEHILIPMAIKVGNLSNGIPIVTRFTCHLRWFI